jgi:hypothetical protein
LKIRQKSTAPNRVGRIAAEAGAEIETEIETEIEA